MRVKEVVKQLEETRVMHFQDETGMIWSIGRGRRGSIPEPGDHFFAYSSDGQEHEFATAQEAVDAMDEVEVLVWGRLKKLNKAKKMSNKESSVFLYQNNKRGLARLLNVGYKLEELNLGGTYAIPKKSSTSEKTGGKE